jgi:hypothetical protein
VQSNASTEEEDNLKALQTSATNETSRSSRLLDPSDKRLLRLLRKKGRHRHRS